MKTNMQVRLLKNREESKRIRVGDFYVCIVCRKTCYYCKETKKYYPYCARHSYQYKGDLNHFAKRQNGFPDARASVNDELQYQLDLREMFYDKVFTYMGRDGGDMNGTDGLYNIFH